MEAAAVTGKIRNLENMKAWFLSPVVAAVAAWIFLPFHEWKNITKTT